MNKVWGWIAARATENSTKTAVAGLLTATAAALGGQITWGAVGVVACTTLVTIITNDRSVK